MQEETDKHQDLVPLPPEGWEESLDWANDTAAQQEETNFGRLDAIEEAKRNKERRIHVALSYMVPCSMLLAFGLFWIGVAIYAFHIFTSWGWLKPEQLKDLHNILFSGAVGAIVSQGTKKYLN